MKHRAPSSTTFAAIACALAVGCAAPSDAGPTVTGADEIVDVPQTEVERQAIGNCWIYAHASWVEAMHDAQAHDDFDVSESYWTYWHWFDQIAAGSGTKISTGGNWQTANSIVKKYGLVAERSFIVATSEAEMSARQASALAIVNESLATGPLSTSVARHTKLIVRAELDRAWGLTPAVTSMLDRVFGADVSRTFTSAASPADASGTDVQRAQDFAVAYTAGPRQPLQRKLLADAMTDWRQAYYNGTDRRAFQVRVQRALHDAQPVIMTWFVDFDALEGRAGPLLGSFNMGTLNQLGPGRQGGHTTVLEDYQAKLADGRVREAGKPLDPTKADDAALLAGALLPSTTVQFFRVKKSWGSAHPERAFAPGMPTYHDLYFDYLDGPVKKCVERDGETDTQSCPTTTTPLQNVVLPPGY